MANEITCLACGWSGTKEQLMVREIIAIKNDERPRCPSCNSIRLKYHKGE